MLTTTLTGLLNWPEISYRYSLHMKYLPQEISWLLQSFTCSFFVFQIAEVFGAILHTTQVCRVIISFILNLLLRKSYFIIYN